MNFNLFIFIYTSIDESATLWQHIAFVPMVFLLLFVILTLLGYFDVHTKVYDKNLDIFYTNLLNKEEN